MNRQLNSIAGTLRNNSIRALSEVRDQVAESSRKVAHKVDRSVHDHPWVYLASAVAGSTLLGFWLGRKSSRLK